MKRWLVVLLAVGVLGLMLGIGAQLQRQRLRVTARSARPPVVDLEAHAREAAQASEGAVRVASTPFSSSWIFEPTGPGPHPAIVLFHGSEGGGAGLLMFTAASLAREGFVALVYAYCGAPGTPEKLVEIEIDDAERAVYWLASQRSVNGGQIGLWGVAQGAEFAVLLAADMQEKDHPRVAAEPIVMIAAVVAHDLPSNVSAGWDWDGLQELKDERGEPRPAWTLRGSAVPPGEPLVPLVYRGPVVMRSRAGEGAAGKTTSESKEFELVLTFFRDFLSPGYQVIQRSSLR